MESLILLFVAYFFPAIVAAARRQNNATAIFVLNLFLGWTLLGWVIALVWAFTKSANVAAR
ncbi:superinfection immunity protein [Phyllobacterium sp. P5_D12]